LAQPSGIGKIDEDDGRHLALFGCGLRLKGLPTAREEARLGGHRPTTARADAPFGGMRLSTSRARRRELGAAGRAVTAPGRVLCAARGTGRHGRKPGSGCYIGSPERDRIMLAPTQYTTAATTKPTR